MRNPSNVAIYVQTEWNKPEDWIASERARQAAMDKLLFSICSEPKTFSKMGQKTRSNESMESSAAGSATVDMERWLNTVPILNSQDYKWEQGQKK